jgi:hypothetical protein
MARIEIDGDSLRVDMVGLDKVLALKSSIEISLDHVRSAELAPEAARGYHGLRLPGTYLPGVITAGSFFNGQWLFFDVHDASKAVKIDLDHEHYAALIVEVPDPETTVTAVNAAIAAHPGRGPGLP